MQGKLSDSKFIGSKWVQISIHISIWLLYYLLNYIFLKNYQIRIRPNFLLVDMVMYIGIFYISYLVLIPLFLFRKKITWFILLSLILLTGSFFIKREYRSFAFEKFLKERKMSKVPSDVLFYEYPNKNIKPGENLPPPPFPERKPFTPKDFSPLSGILLIFMASITISFVQKWRSDETFKSETEKERITAELKYLKQQINPHFLFNSLNSIYSMIISFPTPASDAVLKLSSILRYMLYASENEQVLLSNELEVVNNYLELQKLRLTDKVKVNYVFKGNDENFKIEPHILIPLLENAFKYGVDNITKSFIDIRIEVIENKLFAVISNKVVLKSINMHDSGIGIKNIIRRLELLYPNKYQFDIEEKDNIFTIKLTINLHR